MGNVLSVRRALEHCGADAVLTDRPESVAEADRLLLPGVGAFADCMTALRNRGLIEPIRAFVKTGRSFLGICVGMQILLEVGEEFGEHPGLGFIPGRVTKIDTTAGHGGFRKIPHIGWTPITTPAAANDDHWNGTILAKTAPRTPFYFVHSFTAAPANPEHLLASVDYAGAALVAAVRRDNITGVQFHPEKSGPAGLALIERFVTD